MVVQTIANFMVYFITARVALLILSLVFLPTLFAHPLLSGHFTAARFLSALCAERLITGDIVGARTCVGLSTFFLASIAEFFVLV
jgi:hypothetical protein